jgi:ATP synthase protein I
MGDNPSEHGSETAQGSERKLASASEAELASRLERLEQGLQEHRSAETERRQGRSSDQSGYARAVKIGSEFIAGIVVGVGIGWLIDRGLGTRPWGMIVFLLVGFAAGVLNVLRAEGMLAEPGFRKGPDKGSHPGDEGK